MLFDIANKLVDMLPPQVLGTINNAVEKVLPYIDKPIVLIGAIALGYGILKKVGELIGVVVVLLVVYVILRYIGIDIAALI